MLADDELGKTPRRGPWADEGDPASEPADIVAARDEAHRQAAIAADPSVFRGAVTTPHDLLGVVNTGHALERERLLPEMVMTIERFGYDAKAVAREQDYLHGLLMHDGADDVRPMRGKRSFAVTMSVVVALGFVAGALGGLNIAVGDDLAPAFSFGSLRFLVTAMPMQDADGDGIDDAIEGKGGSDAADPGDPVIEDGRVQVCHVHGGDERPKWVQVHAAPGHVRHGDRFGACAGDGDHGDSDGDGDGDEQHDPDDDGPRPPADRDGDGFSDDVEVAGGSDPDDANDPPVVNGLVAICHQQTIHVAPASVLAHIAHGDQFGECAAPPVDADGDGLPDAWEQDHFGHLDEGPGGDPDGDGLDNLGEYQHGTDPNDPDSDGDGLNDGDEINAGTDPNVADTDDDGHSDGAEVAAGSDPLDADSTPADIDGDGLPDAWEQEHFADLDEGPGGDPDGDGLDNLAENQQGTDPNVADTDGDLFPDGVEVAAGSDPLDPASVPGNTLPLSSGGGGSAGGSGGGGSAAPGPSPGGSAPNIDALIPTPPGAPRIPRLTTLPTDLGEQVTGFPGGLVREALDALNRNLGRLENPTIALAEAGAGSSTVKVGRRVAMLLE